MPSTTGPFLKAILVSIVPVNPVPIDPNLSINAICITPCTLFVTYATASLIHFMPAKPMHVDLGTFTIFCLELYYYLAHCALMDYFEPGHHLFLFFISFFHYLLSWSQGEGEFLIANEDVHYVCVCVG